MDNLSDLYMEHGYKQSIIDNGSKVWRKVGIKIIRQHPWNLEKNLNLKEKWEFDWKSSQPVPEKSTGTSCHDGEVAVRRCLYIEHVRGSLQAKVIIQNWFNIYKHVLTQPDVLVEQGAAEEQKAKKFETARYVTFEWYWLPLSRDIWEFVLFEEWGPAGWPWLPVPLPEAKNNQPYGWTK